MRVGLLWRAEWDPVETGTSVVDTCKLRGVFAAFAAAGVDAEPVVYMDETVAEVREQLLALDGVLVWVNPIEHGRDRSRLDPLLGEIAAAGVFVSAHPDVILKMGTKDVLVETRDMSWGSDTRLYRTAEELEEQLPDRLAEAGPIVLKQHRGMGGDGVWKVELDARRRRTAVARAARGGDRRSRTICRSTSSLNAAGPTSPGSGPMVDQPYQRRLAEGMIRSYLVARPGRRIHASVSARPDAARGPTRARRARCSSRPRRSATERFAAALESEWVPGLQRILGIDTHALPVIWDADFLLGPKTEEKEDTYVLCEINVSSTFAFPEFAMPTVARATLERIRDRATS